MSDQFQDIELATGQELEVFSSVVLSRTVEELNGVTCLDLESDASVQQQIV